MKVKATKKGFYGRYREKDDIFDYDGITSKEVDGKKVDYFPSWMKPLESVRKQVPKASKAKKAETPDSAEE